MKQDFAVVLIVAIMMFPLVLVVWFGLKDDPRRISGRKRGKK